MRMAGASALLVLVLEALLLLAFVLGFYWLDGWRGGLLVAGAVLLVMLLPWVGELRAWFDSAGPVGTVKLAWWGRISFRAGVEATELRGRVLFVPWRKRISRQKEKEEAETAVCAEPPSTAEAEPEPEARRPRRSQWLRRLNADTVEGAARLALSGLQAANDLVWSAAEIKVRVDDIVQQETADRTLARVFGLRGVGPINIMMATDEGKRRVRLRYRISLLRAALAGLQVLVEGRPMAVVRSMRRRDEREPATTADGDRELIDRIMQEREDGRDV